LTSDVDATPPTTCLQSVSIATSVGPASSHKDKSVAKEAPCVFEQNTRRHFTRQAAGIERDKSHAERGGN
jgi:hypothetical protein